MLPSPWLRRLCTTARLERCHVPRNLVRGWSLDPLQTTCGPSSGGHHRLDYVAIDKSWGGDAKKECWVKHEMGLMNVKEDHRPTFMNLEATFVSNERYVMYKPWRPDQPSSTTQLVWRPSSRSSDHFHWKSGMCQLMFTNNSSLHSM